MNDQTPKKTEKWGDFLFTAGWELYGTATLLAGMLTLVCIIGNTVGWAKSGKWIPQENSIIINSISGLREWLDHPQSWIGISKALGGVLNSPFPASIWVFLIWLPLGALLLIGGGFLSAALCSTWENRDRSL